MVTGLLTVDFASVASHMFLIAFWTALAAGYLRGAILHPAPLFDPRESRLSLGIVSVGTALGLVNLLFLLFVVIQLRYLFGGTGVVQTTAAMTYAEYARRGFFELVMASAL